MMGWIGISIFSYKWLTELCIIIYLIGNNLLEKTMLPFYIACLVYGITRIGAIFGSLPKTNFGLVHVQIIRFILILGISGVSVEYLM